jgi:integrase
MPKVIISVVIDPQYNRSSKPNKSGEYPVHIQLKKDRKHVSIIPDIPKIPFELFKNGKSEWIHKSHPNARKINLILSKLVNILDEYLLDKGSRSLTPQEVKDWYLKNHTKAGEYKDFKSEKLKDYFESKFPKRGKSHSTIVQYENAVKYLEKYNPDTRFFDFDRKFVEKLALFLGSHEKIKGTSGSTYFDKIKAVYIHWYGESFPDEPAGYEKILKRVTVKKEKPKVNRGFTRSELDAFMDLDLSGDPKSEMVRDVIVFMCYSSRYLKEILPLSFEDVQINPKNQLEMAIVSSRKKTKSPFANVILPGVHIAIFEKYHPVKSGPLFPQVRELLGFNPHAKFIYILKKLTVRIGMGNDFIPGTKIGRVTFESLIGLPLDSYTRMIIMGHANPRTQERYISGFNNIFELTEKLTNELSKGRISGS